MSRSSSSIESPLRAHWTLEPGRIFLNHGSYGACPRVVQEEQSALRRELENSPSNFMNRLYPKLLKSTREQLCQFLHCRPEELALVTNATSGVNAVLRSLAWNSGEEILLTDHGYNACANVVGYLVESHGVQSVRVELPFPDIDDSTIVEAVLEAVTPRTRLALLDHVTSPTAIVFPLERLACELASRGVSVLVDGAHAPGMLNLDLQKLSEAGVDYYTGNFHKWCCAPRGSAFLWVRQERQKGLHPVVISHGFAGPVELTRFLQEFDWGGTFDPTAWLVTPRALDFHQQLDPGGWDTSREKCRELLRQGRLIVSQALPIRSPDSEKLLGQMATLELSPEVDPQSLYFRLYDDYGIDSWLTRWNDRTLLRLSAAPYNILADYEDLAKALGETL